MKRIHLFTCMILSILTSCNPSPIVIEDLSQVQEVKLIVDSETDPWLAGISKHFYVNIFPETAIGKEFTLRCSNPDALEIVPGIASNEFIATAITGGSTYGEMNIDVWGEVDGIQSKKISFNLIDKRPKPKAPSFTLSLANAAAPNSKTQIESYMITDCGSDYAITFDLEDKSQFDKVSVDFSNSCPEVVSLKKTSNKSWMAKSLIPGKANLTMSITDGDGNEFTFDFIYVSYGHISLDAEFCAPFGLGGFYLDEYPYESTMANIHVNTYIISNIYDLSADVITKTVVTDVYTPIDDEDNNMIIDCKDVIDEISSHYAKDSHGQNAPYHPVEVRLSFVITLDNPFIIIDKITDDTDRKENKYSDISIIAILQQEGVETFE